MLHIIHNVQTDIIEEVPYTEAEILKAEKANAIWAAEQAVRDAEEEAKAAEKQAILDKLGITEEEAALLLGGN